MSKTAKLFRDMDLQELKEKEQELGFTLMKAEAAIRGHGAKRLSSSQTNEKSPSLRKIRRMIATLLTIKKEKEKE